MLGVLVEKRKDIGMLWFDVLAIATPMMVLVTSAAYYAGRRRERREMLPAADRAARYKLACRDVMTWCCEDDLKAARMTARQIMACGEGEGLNAGTPLDDEPCTVNGLREQLRRMRKTPNVEVSR